ncbi:DsbA family protein [Macrococcus armenti]|uniref:DsbA family protein n=1 Tax=Macrococcus armenti TaxID=2875764 RepID=UPI001CC97DAE|nr:thioredoxin domain-containing protein [Macrococcus armenti]UBH22371.1 DsbA family protein [Macrococcus armenti]
MKNKGSLIFTMVMTLLVVGVIAALVITKKNGDSSDESQIATDSSKGLQAIEKIDTKGQPQMGKKDAKVKIIEFGDFKCPACRYFETDIKPEIEKKYIDTGKAELYFIHSPFHGEESIFGGLAGETVLKQAPDKYWAFQKAIYELQPDTDQEWLSMTAVKEAAKKAGIKDLDKLEKAIDNKTEEAGLKKDIELVTKHNITMTPTIIVNGKEVANPMDIKEVEAAIEKALK